jgi:hypothetical protein
MLALTLLVMRLLSDDLPHIRCVLQTTVARSRMSPVITAHLLNLSLLAVHMAVLALQLTLTMRVTDLPNRVTAQHHVYEHVATAEARILLSSKSHAFPVLDGSNAIDDVNSVPLCGSDLFTTQKVTQMPLWALPNDESGLQQLTNEAVCNDDQT